MNKQEVLDYFLFRILIIFEVVANGRRIEPIEQTIAEIKALGGEGFAMSCDSADRARVEDTTYDNMLKAWQSGVIGSLNYMQNRSI